MLADGQGVEKLVGHEEERAVGKVLDAVMPSGGGIAEGLGLDRAEDGRRFDEMDPGGLGEARHGAGGAQDVGHQRAAPGAELGQHERARPPLVEPGLREAEAQHLAEHLADLRRGGEIAGRAQRIARGVVAPARVEQTFGHVIRDRQRPRRGDPRQKRVPQAHAGRRAERSARSAAQMPTTSIGNDRT